MKNLFIITTMLLMASCATVPAGYTGVKVNVLGSDKGAITAVPTGRYMMWPNVEYHNFPLFNQNYVWTKSREESSPRDESFTFSINGMPVNVDVGIEYSLNADKILELFLKYRKNVDELTSITIRNVVRDNFNKYSLRYDIDTLMSGGMNELISMVLSETTAYFADDGIVIISLSLVAAPRYPESIVAAIEEKNKATQRAIQRENELREVEAESQKTIAQSRAKYESAKFQALANRELSSSFSTTLISKMELEVQQEWIKKWDGKLPTTIAGDSTLLMQPGK